MADFHPRLNNDGMMGNRYWYDDNPFWQADYGLPNCTCYAWGRFWEEAGSQYRPQLSLGNGADWYGYNDGYARGRTPALGAVACYSGGSGGFGHVAIVEVITDSYFIVSESVYGGNYFQTNRCSLNGDHPYSNLHFQGFIYNPHTDAPISGGGKLRPWMIKHIIERNNM